MIKNKIYVFTLIISSALISSCAAIVDTSQAGVNLLCSTLNEREYCVDKPGFREDPYEYFVRAANELVADVEKDSKKLNVPIQKIKLLANLNDGDIVTIHPIFNQQGTNESVIEKKYTIAILEIINQTCNKVAAKSNSLYKINQYKLKTKNRFEFSTVCLIEDPSKKNKDRIAFEILNSKKILLGQIDLMTGKKTSVTHPDIRDLVVASSNTGPFEIRRSDFIYQKDLDSVPQVVYPTPTDTARAYQTIIEICKAEEKAIFDRNLKWRREQLNKGIKIGLETNCGKVVKVDGAIISIIYNGERATQIINTTIDHLYEPGGSCIIDIKTGAIFKTTPFNQLNDPATCSVRKSMGY